MNKRFIKLGLVASLTVGLWTWAAPAAAQKRIDELAPEQSLLVVGAPNVGHAMRQLKEGPLGRLWNQPDVQEATLDMREGLEFMLEMMSMQFGVEPEDIGWPEGTAGLAVFMAMNADLGLELPGLLMVIDFGGRAEKMMPIVDNVMGMMQMEGRVTGKQEIAGRTVYTVVMNTNDDDDDDDFGDDDFDDFDMMMDNPWAGLAGGLQTMLVAPSGNYLLASSDEAVLRETFGKLDGRAGRSVANRPEFQAALRQIEGSEVYAVLMTQGLGSVIEGAGPAMMLMPMIEAPLETIGIGGVKALSVGMDVDHAGALMAQRIGVYMPEGKTGLLKLLDVDSAKGELPAFVGPEAIGYSRYNFRFDGVMGVVREVIAAMPDDVQFMAEDAMMQVGPMIEQMLAGLGPEIHAIQFKADPQPAGGGMNPVMGPLPVDLAGRLWAIRSTNIETLQGMLAMFAPQAGLEQREFLGQTVYSDPMGMVTIGFGGGYLMVGDGSSVEQALRATTQRNLPSLSETPDFKRAIGFLPAGNAIAWGYTDTANAMQSAIAAAGNAAGMGAMGGMGMMMDDLPDLSVLTKHFGPGVWEMRSTPDGFAMHFFSLPAAK